jgi:hypothetical protein
VGQELRPDQEAEVSATVEYHGRYDRWGNVPLEAWACSLSVTFLAIPLPVATVCGTSCALGAPFIGRLCVPNW